MQQNLALQRTLVLSLVACTLIIGSALPLTGTQALAVRSRDPQAIASPTVAGPSIQPQPVAGTPAAPAAAAPTLATQPLPVVAPPARAGLAPRAGVRPADSSVGLANSGKPDWRGDYANTGQLPGVGPATQPSQVFSVTVPGGDPTSGIELDSNNNVIVNELNGQVLSYSPSGALNWSAKIPSGTGTDFSCPSAQPVVSANGSVYITDDVGNLWQLDPAGVATGGSVTPALVFQDPNGAGFLGTPKLGPDNSVYLEDAAGSLFAVGLNGTENYEFDATGSVQVAGAYKGVRGTSPFKSCGEPALDPSSGVAYYTSMDTNTHFGKSLTLGSLYAVDPSGNLLWSKAMPLLAQSESAVLYVAPGNGGGTDGTVIVTDEHPEIAAFDALTGAQLWSVAPPNPAPLVASPTLSVDGTTVYVVNTAGELYAYDVATGTLNTAFGTNGVVTVSAGKGTVSAPVVDAAGRIYVVGNDGTLYCFDASGNQLWTIAGGVGPGETGMIGPKAMTPAIDTHGMLYVTGTSGNVRGFAVAGLANSPKPDWRGDYANTGRLPGIGPASQPSQVFGVTVPGGDPTSGVEIDSYNDVLVNELNGQLLSYSPGGTLNWSATTGPTGTDFSCPSAQPVVGANGSIYTTDDLGDLWEIQHYGGPGGFPGIVYPTLVFQDPNGAGFLGTPKLGPDNTIYLEDSAGSLFAVGPSGTETYEFDATGSVQVAGAYKGVRSTSPYKSCGEPALDPSSGVAYYTSMDTNTHFGKSLTLGSLYAVDPSGNLLWSKAMPLLAQSESAVLYVAPGNGGGTDGTVIVTDERPEIAAFDALTGAQLWSVAPPNPAPLVASPTLSVDGTTVYVANTGGEMYAYDVATGTLNSAFGTNGVVTVSAGKGTVSAPVVDAAGRIYVVGNDGTLYCFDASGNQLWTIAGGVGPGETGMIAPKAMTAAIDANGTLYVTGTSGNVRGFADVGPPPDTATPTQTGTVTPTPTITPTPSITLTPSITPTPSATGTPTATSDVTNTPVESGPAPGWSMLGGSASHTGFAPVSIDLSHAPGTLWATNLVPLLGGTKPVRQSAVSGPDGTVYQPDGNGALVALDPASGAIKWRSADVLGQVQPPTSFPVLDTGSSAAVAANGTIYAGSENGGIYSFSPTDGSDHEISTDGTYQNSSIVIGPDGTLYGASVDGTVYALSPTGQAYWAAGDGYQITNCPPASTLSIISTPALDQNGNLYIGYTCKTSTAAYKGGVISLNPDGTLRWHQNNTNSGGSPVPFGAVFGPAVLSPDGSTLYVVDTGGAGGKQLVALNTSNGQVKWSFAAGGDIETPPVLSADGQHLYLTVSAVQQGPSGGRPYEDSPLIEFNPDGSVANALHLAQDPLLDDSYTTVRPVVDADGNLLLVTAHNLLGYSGDLSHQLFPPFFLGVTQASTFLGGLSVDSTGHIYVSDNSGNLLALSSAIIQPTATPVNTAFPPPTQITRPTSTPFVFFPTAKPVVTEPPSARETAIASILAPNCQLYLLPNPHIVQQGGAETIRVKGLPNDAVTVEVAGAASDSWLGAAREYANGTDSTVAFTFNGVANRSYWSTSITIPAGGNVLLVWQVPATAVSAFYGVYAITTSSTCHQYSNLSVPGRHLEEAGSLYNFGFNVWPPSYTTFDTKIQQGLKDGLIRSVEPAYTPDIVPSVVYAQPDTAPTLANTNSAVYDHVHVLTAPGSMVELQEWVVAKPITTGVPTQTQNQISGYPAPVALPAKFFDATTTANQTHTNSNGSVNTYANFLVPVWSNLVIPGRGITIERVVYINGHLIITGDYQVRETRLRLVIQANESTRGDQRAVITLNRPHAGNSHTTVTVTVLADKGATLTARLVLHGTTYFPINATPIVTGNGGRVHLKFTVVDGSAPTPPHAVQTAQLMVTSTFRGATISRTATIFYQQK